MGNLHPITEKIQLEIVIKIDSNVVNQFDTLCPVQSSVFSFAGYTTKWMLRKKFFHLSELKIVEKQMIFYDKMLAACSQFKWAW